MITNLDRHRRIEFNFKAVFGLCFRLFRRVVSSQGRRQVTLRVGQQVHIYRKLPATLPTIVRGRVVPALSALILYLKRNYSGFPKYHQRGIGQFCTPRISYRTLCRQLTDVSTR